MSTEFSGEHEALLQFLYRAPIGLVQTNLAGDIEMINPMSARLLMPLSVDANLINLFAVLGRFAPDLRRLTAAYEQSSGVICESLRVPIVAGESDCPAETPSQVLSVSLLKLDDARLMAVLCDATIEVEREQQGLVRRLSTAAHTDTLTQLPNRAAAHERLRLALERVTTEPGNGLAVLFLNCDRFRQINDTLGHAAGDKVLGLITERVRSTLRAAGRRVDGAGLRGGAEPMAARLGSDEFLVVLEDLARPDDVHAVASRLLDVLGKPYGIGAQQLHCGFSMGVVLGAQASEDADTVLQDASIAMVEAKRAGGGRYVVFEPAMRQRAAHRAGTEADLRRALAEGQLFVVYQPVVAFNPDGAPGRAASVEALVRWRHPVRGLIPPVEFIVVAEETGLIGPLGDFVLATACVQFMAWQSSLGPRAPKTLAVNLSRAQLHDATLVESVRTLLGVTGMQPEQLQLEVTESFAAQDETVKARLHELKAIGITLALDDFGTGYSSLSSLHLLPVHTVKVDRSFVSQADTSRHHRVLIEATIRVANSLGMSTVAEGIETAAQESVVRQLGCDKGQGYLFSKPLTADELVRWLSVEESCAA
jgi:diguanylate cyclase (GGDEF)-like protein